MCPNIQDIWTRFGASRRQTQGRCRHPEGLGPLGAQLEILKGIYRLMCYELIYTILA